MKAITGVLFRLFCCAVMFGAPVISFGQQAAESQLQTDLVSSWLVTVEGEGRTRTLKIMGAAQKADGMLLLEAVYGWTDGNQTPIPASASQSGQESKLLFATQSGSQITAVRTLGGTFEGTFTDKKGVVKAVKIEKVSDDELHSKIVAAKVARAASIVIKPAENVPGSCGAFSGQWTGTWSQGGIGQWWLWVVEVDANCVAKYAYLGHSNPPTSFTKREIKDDALSIPNRSTGGVSVFKRNGDDLWANYSNPGGGTNSAVFVKVQ